MSNLFDTANPYHSFVIDEPVMVRYNDISDWLPRHFAGVSEDGLALAFDGGFTSWTSENGNKTAWHDCRRPTKKELKKI